NFLNANMEFYCGSILYSGTKIAILLPLSLSNPSTSTAVDYFLSQSNPCFTSILCSNITP
ncbi:hypothetical protein L9F63_017123, partial [Diploptera punctata]